jgi:hypothetical protein
MRKKHAVRILHVMAIGSASALLLFGCPECNCNGGEGIRCGPLLVYASKDIQTEVGQHVVLRSEARLPPEDKQVCLFEKEAVTYSWKQVTGPSLVALSGADYMDASFIPDKPGTYEFSVRATYHETNLNREKQHSDLDFVQVKVSQKVCGNPVSDAGPDQTISKPASAPVNIVLDGSKSHADPSFGCRDMPITGYRWTVAEHPTGSNINFVNGETPRSTVSLSVPGEYRFELQVWDSEDSTDTDTMLLSLVEQRPCDAILEVKIIDALKRLPISGVHVTVVDAEESSHVTDTNEQGLAVFDSLATGRRKSITAVSDEIVPALPGTNDDDRPRFENTTVLDHCTDQITIPMKLTASGEAAIPIGTITAKVPQHIFDMLPHSNRRFWNCVVDDDCGETYRCEDTSLGDRKCTPRSLLPFYSLGDNRISGQLRAAILMPILPVDSLSSLPLNRLFAKPTIESDIWPGSLATDDSFLNGLSPSLGRDPWGDKCIRTSECPDTENYYCEQDPQGDYRCKDTNPLRNLVMDANAGKSVRLALIGGIVDVSEYFGMVSLFPYLFNDGDVDDFPALLKGLKLNTLFICMLSVDVTEGVTTDITNELGSLTSDDCWHVEYTTKEALVGLQDPDLMNVAECKTDEDCCDRNGTCGLPHSELRCITDPNNTGKRYCQLPLFRVQIISESKVAPKMAGTGLDPRASDADIRMRSWLPEWSPYEVFCDERYGCDFSIYIEPPYRCDPPQIESISVPGDVECMFPYGLSIAALDFPEGHGTLPEGGRVIVGIDFGQTLLSHEDAPGILVPRLDLPALQGASLTVARLNMRNVVYTPDTNFGTPPGKLGTSAVTDSVSSSIDLHPLMAPESLGPEFDAGMDIEVIFMPEDSTVWPNPAMKRVYAEVKKLKSPLTAMPPRILPPSITLSNLPDGTLRSVVLSKVDREGNYYGVRDPQWRIYAPAGTTTIPVSGNASPFSTGEEVWVSIEKAGFDVPFDYDLFPVDLILRGQVTHSEDSYALTVAR